MLGREFRSYVFALFSLLMAITIAPAAGHASSIDFAPVTIPNPTLGVAYSQTFTDTGDGVAPITFAVVSGSLPPGLSLSAGGVLSGTPTTTGTYTFTIRESDTHPLTNDQSYTVTVGVSTGISSGQLKQARQAVNTQLASAQPRSQISNILRRIEVANIASSQAVTTIPPGDSTLGKLSSSFQPNGNEPWERTSDRGDTLDHLSSLGNFSLSLDERPQRQPGGSDRLRLPSGGDPARLTLWGQYSSNTSHNGQADARTSGMTRTYTLGADWRATPGLLVGTAFGFGRTNLDTEYNSGAYHENVYTLSPYLSWQSPRHRLGLELAGGLSRGAIDSTRGGITGTSTSNTWFVAGTGTARLTPTEKPLKIEGRLSTLIGERWTSAYTESDGTYNDSGRTAVAQIRPGAEIGYRLHVDTVEVEPFVRAENVWDAGDTINGDHQAEAATVGVRAVKGPVFGSIDFEQEFGRSHYSSKTVAGLVGYRFDMGKSGTVAPSLKVADTPNGGEIGGAIRFQSERGISLDLSATRSEVGDISRELQSTDISANPALRSTGTSLHLGLTVAL